MNEQHMQIIRNHLRIAAVEAGCQLPPVCLLAQPKPNKLQSLHERHHMEKGYKIRRVFLLTALPLLCYIQKVTVFERVVSSLTLQRPSAGANLVHPLRDVCTFTPPTAVHTVLGLKPALRKYIALFPGWDSGLLFQHWCISIPRN